MQVSEKVPEVYEFPSDWDIELNFGQYKGMTPRQIVEADKNTLQYLLWAIDNVHHYKPSNQFTEEVRAQWERFQELQEISGEYHAGYRWDYGVYPVGIIDDDDDDPDLDWPEDDDIPF